MYYVGVTDGGGDYGSAVCDEYECPACGWVDEAGCIEVGDAEVYEDEAWGME
jgi:hypothetical protein